MIFLRNMYLNIRVFETCENNVENIRKRSIFFFLENIKCMSYCGWLIITKLVYINIIEYQYLENAIFINLLDLWNYLQIYNREVFILDHTTVLLEVYSKDEGD